MSCVVGLIDKGKVWMGADGIATTDEGEKRPIKTVKLISNGPYLFGFSGKVRPGQLLQPHYFDPPPNILDLPDALIELYGEKGCLITTDEQTSVILNNILIGYKRKIYEILLDFQLNEVIGGFTAIGAGCLFAFGSLHTSFKLAPDMDPKERIKLALETASEYLTSCGPPYEIRSM